MAYAGVNPFRITGFIPQDWQLVVFPGAALVAAYAILPFAFWSQIAACVAFLVPTLVQFVVTTASNILFYAFILIIVLIPTIVVVGVLAYRTKPTKESFDAYLKEFVNMHVPDQMDVPKQFYWRILYKVSFGLMKTKMILQLQKDLKQYHYDLAVCRIVWANDDSSSAKFVGIFGAWFPTPF